VHDKVDKTTYFKSPTSSPMHFWHFKCVKYALYLNPCLVTSHFVYLTCPSDVPHHTYQFQVHHLLGLIVFLLFWTYAICQYEYRAQWSLENIVKHFSVKVISDVLCKRHGGGAFKGVLCSLLLFSTHVISNKCCSPHRMLFYI
jgi:hypothetical protein